MAAAASGPSPLVGGQLSCVTMTFLTFWGHRDFFVMMVINIFVTSVPMVGVVRCGYIVVTNSGDYIGLKSRCLICIPDIPPPCDKES